MTVTERVAQDLKEAMRAGDASRLSTLRFLTSALHNAKIEHREKFTDDVALSILRREVKKRKEAVDAYTKGGRVELADKELVEAHIIESYLPAQLSREEIVSAVDEALKDFGSQAQSVQFGPVMKAVMQKLKGQADGKVVGDIVREKLAGK